MHAWRPKSKGCVKTLQMRIHAYQRTPISSSPVDDLRQVLRDTRGILTLLKEGSPMHEEYSSSIPIIEAEIRKRIAADLAALKLADD